MTLRTAAISLALVSVAACGSTVQSSGALQGGDDGLSQAQGGGSAAASAPQSVSTHPSTRTQVPGQSERPAPQEAAAIALPSTESTTRPLSGSQVGVGFTTKTANIGINYLTGGEAVFAAVGASGIALGDARSFSQALINLLNKRGGVLGRKLVPVFHEVKATDSAETANQATCAAFTQDAKVFGAVWGPVACLSKAHVPSLGAGTQEALDRQFYDDYAPYRYEPALMDSDAVTPLLLDRLQAKGFLASASRIGLFYADNVVEKRVNAKLKKALLVRGFNVVAEYGFDGSSVTSTANSGNSAVLKFQTSRVDRVISFNANVGFLMIAAEQQHYRPRYGLTTYLNLASVQEVVPPKEQLAGSVGIGWQPTNDVDRAYQPKLAGHADCAQAAKDSGQNPSGSAQFILYSYCDAIRTLVFGAEHGGSLTPEGIRQGLTKAGAFFPTALNFRSAYGHGRYDGALTARDIAYDTSCSCFRYQGSQLYLTH